MVFCMDRSIKKITKIFLYVLFLTVSFGMPNALAAERIVNLVVGYKTVYFAGKARKAIAINDEIPAPTLHFKEGDHVTIRVHNHLNEETAIHWHGILVPWQMDGVLGISQRGIQPGKVFNYQFTLKQSGTYWYHAHAGLQEQQGLYGAFLIAPSKSPSYRYTKDFAIVLSDWSNTHADQILANLKKEGNFYSPKFPLQPSLTKFVYDYRASSKDERIELLDDYKMMQQTRMGIYDLSDVAYDAFLLNGHLNLYPWTAFVKIGDVVRLRFIDAGGSSIFNVKIPGTVMKIVQVDGNDVIPHTVSEFAIAPGETYDVLVKIKKNMPYIIYAESRDTLGAAYGALITAPHQVVNYKRVQPFPEPINISREMMSMIMEKMNQGFLPMKHRTHHQTMRNHSTTPEHAMSDAMVLDSSMPMNHSMHMDENMKNMNSVMMNHSMKMTMPIEPSIIGDTFSSPTSFYSTTFGTKYQNLVAAVKTNNPNNPVSQVIKMELFGYMDRFIWFINGVPEYNTHSISLNPGKRYRFIFTNNSMMHHPMHIHGHWFILRIGQGEYDPLLHTIDVPPGATITADVDTDASGQWFFHCHMLYHMTTGMSRVFQYATLIDITKGEAKPQHIIQQTSYVNRPIVRIDEVRSIDSSLVKHPMAHPAGFWLANFLDIGADPFHNAERLTYKGLFGPDYHKLELFTNDAEVFKGTLENADIDIFYWHLISQFWAIKGGVNYFNQPSKKPYWQAGLGLEGVMPYFIDTNARLYFYSGSVKLDIELSRDTQITNNFFIRTGLRGISATKTVTSAGLGSNLNQMRYMVRPYYRLAPGLNVFVEYENEEDYGKFKSIEKELGEQTNQNTVTLGLTMLF